MTLIASSLFSEPRQSAAGSVESEPSVGLTLRKEPREEKPKEKEDDEDQYEGSVEDQLAKDALHDRLSTRAKLATNSYSAQPKAAQPSTTRSMRPKVAVVQPESDQSDLGMGSQEESSANNQMPGRPGVDYPIHWQVPKTSFDCRNYEQSGFYADVESDCQAYHSCHKGRGGRHTFLCPNGTLFSQELLTCDWWYNVECSASKLYLAPGNEQPAGSSSSAGTRSNLISDLMANLREPLEIADVRRHVEA